MADGGYYTGVFGRDITGGPRESSATMICIPHANIAGVKECIVVRLEQHAEEERSYDATMGGPCASPNFCDFLHLATSTPLTRPLASQAARHNAT